MPYITTEKVKEIRNELKATFPEIKFSVSRHGHSEVCVAIMESPYQWEPPYQQLNEFHPELEENPELVKKICKVVTKGKRTMVHDQDYGAVPNFYVSIAVGKWNRPHVQTNTQMAVKA